MKQALLTVGFCLCAMTAQAQIQIDSLSPVAVSSVQSNPTDKMYDFMRSEEVRTCSELRSFARDVLLKDENVIAAVQTRNTRQVAEAASKYATILDKDFDAGFLFYHPNTRFFVRVNDKNYRGRMRLPAEMAVSSSACYWERLPSQDVVYSVLVKADDDTAGTFKISKKLTRMVSNLPDVLSEFGKGRVYTALDKMGLKKRTWFKMRMREPNRVRGAGWCTTEDLAFLTSIGEGKKLQRKTQKKLLSLVDSQKEFNWHEMNLSGGIMPIQGLDDERIGAVVYTLEGKPLSANVGVNEQEAPEVEAEEVEIDKVIQQQNMNLE